MLYSEKKYLDYEGLKYYHTKMMERIGNNITEIEGEISDVEDRLNDRIDSNATATEYALTDLENEIQNKTEIQISNQPPTQEDIKLYVNLNQEGYVTILSDQQTSQMIDNKINGSYFRE